MFNHNLSKKKHTLKKQVEIALKLKTSIYWPFLTNILLGMRGQAKLVY